MTMLLDNKVSNIEGDVGFEWYLNNSFSLCISIFIFEILLLFNVIFQYLKK